MYLCGLGKLPPAIFVEGQAQEARASNLLARLCHKKLDSSALSVETADKNEGSS